MSTIDTVVDNTYLRELLAANDATQAMQVVVNHVRVRLHCDVAWAGLVDGDRLVMGAHSGVRSTEMASAWQLRVGAGIGGRVVSERRSHMSRDYRRDSRRVPLMKRLIDDEGIQATLTVPLLMADEALGVLYAANRRPYPWSEGELSILEQVGRDLAIRLRQLDVDGRHDARTLDAEAKLRSLAQTVENSVRLVTTLAAEPDVSAAITALSGYLDCQVSLMRHDGVALHSAGADPAADEVADTAVEVHRYSLPLPATDGHNLVLRTSDRPDEHTRAGWELAAGILAQHLLRAGERSRALEAVNSEMLDQLLTGRIVDAAALRLHLSLLGLGGRQGQIWVIGDREGDPLRLQSFAEQLAAISDRQLRAVRGSRLVVVVDHTTTAEDLAELLNRPTNKSLIAGIGRICTDVEDYAMSYDQALAAAEIGLRRNYPESILNAHDLGILAMASVPVPYLISTVRDVLGPLIDADQRRGTELVHTLRSYLSHDRHLPATAAALHVHYNTVRNRIARIESLLAIDMHDVEARFRLESALRMHALVWPVDTHD